MVISSLKKLFLMENKKSSGQWRRQYAVLFIVICSCFLLLLPVASFSQYTRYWIQFTDKNNNPNTISNPSTYLSARAIKRRQNQGIAILQNDLPVTPAYIDSVQKIPNVSLLNRSKWFNAITIYTKDTNAINKIKTFPFVLKTKPVQKYSRKETDMERNENSFFVSNSKFEIPDSKTQVVNSKTHQASSPYNYGPSYNQINMVGGVCMHDSGFHGEGHLR